MKIFLELKLETVNLSLESLKSCKYNMDLEEQMFVEFSLHSVPQNEHVLMFIIRYRSCLERGQRAMLYGRCKCRSA